MSVSYPALAAHLAKFIKEKQEKADSARAQMSSSQMDAGARTPSTSSPSATDSFACPLRVILVSHSYFLTTLLKALLGEHMSYHLGFYSHFERAATTTTGADPELEAFASPTPTSPEKATYIDNAQVVRLPKARCELKAGSAEVRWSFGSLYLTCTFFVKATYY
jgi:hypothetical protein